MTPNKYKKISVSESVYNKILEDKEHFTKTIGYNFSFSATINEYHKILHSLKKWEKKKKTIRFTMKT